jgi:hypothetical protein
MRLIRWFRIGSRTPGHLEWPGQEKAPFVASTHFLWRRAAPQARLDDGRGGLNARITFRAEQAGTYRIQATTCNTGVVPFTLTVREQANPPNEPKK